MQIDYDEQDVRHVESIISLAQWRTNKSGNKIIKPNQRFRKFGATFALPFPLSRSPPLSLRWIFQLNLAPGDAFNNPLRPSPFWKVLLK